MKNHNTKENENRNNYTKADLEILKKRMGMYAMMNAKFKIRIRKASKSSLKTTPLAAPSDRSNTTNLLAPGPSGIPQTTTRTGSPKGAFRSSPNRVIVQKNKPNVEEKPQVNRRSYFDAQNQETLLKTSSQCVRSQTSLIQSVNSGNQGSIQINKSKNESRLQLKDVRSPIAEQFSADNTNFSTIQRNIASIQWNALFNHKSSSHVNTTEQWSGTLSELDRYQTDESLDESLDDQTENNLSRLQLQDIRSPIAENPSDDHINFSTIQRNIASIQWNALFNHKSSSHVNTTEQWSGTFSELDRYPTDESLDESLDDQIENNLSRLQLRDIRSPIAENPSDDNTNFNIFQQISSIQENSSHASNPEKWTGTVSELDKHPTDESLDESLDDQTQSNLSRLQLQDIMSPIAENPSDDTNFNIFQRISSIQENSSHANNPAKWTGTVSELDKHPTDESHDESHDDQTQRNVSRLTLKDVRSPISENTSSLSADNDNTSTIQLNKLGIIIDDTSQFDRQRSFDVQSQEPSTSSLENIKPQIIVSKHESSIRMTSQRHALHDEHKQDNGEQLYDKVVNRLPNEHSAHAQLDMGSTITPDGLIHSSDRNIPFDGVLLLTQENNEFSIGDDMPSHILKDAHSARTGLNKKLPVSPRSTEMLYTNDTTKTNSQSDRDYQTTQPIKPFQFYHRGLGSSSSQHTTGYDHHNTQQVTVFIAEIDNPPVTYIGEQSTHTTVVDAEQTDVINDTANEYTVSEDDKDDNIARNAPKTTRNNTNNTDKDNLTAVEQAETSDPTHVYSNTDSKDKLLNLRQLFTKVLYEKEAEELNANDNSQDELRCNGVTNEPLMTTFHKPSAVDTTEKYANAVSTGGKDKKIDDVHTDNSKNVDIFRQTREDSGTNIDMSYTQRGTQGIGEQYECITSTGESVPFKKYGNIAVCNIAGRPQYMLSELPELGNESWQAVKKTLQVHEFRYGGDVNNKIYEFYDEGLLQMKPICDSTLLGTTHHVEAYRCECSRHSPSTNKPIPMNRMQHQLVEEDCHEQGSYQRWTCEETRHPPTWFEQQQRASEGSEDETEEPDDILELLQNIGLSWCNNYSNQNGRNYNGQN